MAHKWIENEGSYRCTKCGLRMKLKTRKSKRAGARRGEVVNFTLWVPKGSKEGFESGRTPACPCVEVPR
jgi:DNA-directed RNA polymerase subunit RPC12/RpoP